MWRKGGDSWVPGRHHCSVRKADLEVFSALVNRFQGVSAHPYMSIVLLQFQHSSLFTLKTNVVHCSYMYIFYCLQKVHITYILHEIEIRPKLYTSWIDKSYTCSFILNTGSKDRLKLLTIAVIRMTTSFSAMGNNTHIETGPKDLVLGWYWTQVSWLEAFSLFSSAVLVFVYILQVSTQNEIISSRQYIVTLLDYN